MSSAWRLLRLIARMRVCVCRVTRGACMLLCVYAHKARQRVGGKARPAMAAAGELRPASGLLAVRVIACWYARACMREFVRVPWAWGLPAGCGKARPATAHWGGGGFTETRGGGAAPSATYSVITCLYLCACMRVCSGTVAWCVCRRIVARRGQPRRLRACSDPQRACWRCV